MTAAMASDSLPTTTSPTAAVDSSLAGKRIVIISYGSRGDVQPFVALGVRLEMAGCRVLILTNSDHQDFVSSFSLDFVGTAGSCREDHQRPEFVRGIETNDFAAFWAWHFGHKRAHMSEISQKECDAVESFTPDLIYATPLTYENACRMSDKLGVPMILGSLFPMQNPLSLLGFRPFQAPKHQTLIHWSPALTKVPVWLKLSHRVTGFLVVEEDERERREVQQEGSGFGGDVELCRLKQFLADGPPPVYMGWGSMIVPKSTACLAVRALKKAGLRGVILGGWAGLGAHMVEGEPDQKELEEYIADNVLFAQSAPHEWLFPRCVATVHHGGAGTVAAALRAGVPTVITPCGLDQPDNARIVEENGCGIAMGHISTLTAEDLGSALERCATDTDMQARCSAMGKQLRSEDGLHLTVCAVDRYLQEKDAHRAAQANGQANEGRPAWQYAAWHAAKHIAKHVKRAA